MNVQTQPTSRFGIYCIVAALFMAFTFLAVVSTLRLQRQRRHPVKTASWTAMETAFATMIRAQ
jgi:hypothetical protein